MKNFIFYTFYKNIPFVNFLVNFSKTFLQAQTPMNKAFETLVKNVN